MKQIKEVTGECLCGDISYKIIGNLSEGIYCHCTQCRKTSGHFGAFISVKIKHLLFMSKTNLQWYKSSKNAKRGFCNNCGSSLFWQPKHQKYIAIAAGSINKPCIITMREHIFTSDAGDYYRLSDDLKKSNQDANDHWLDNKEI